MKWLLVTLSLIGMLYLSHANADLKVGTPVFRPPFVLSPTEGFDIDLINQICKDMHVNCKFYPMRYDDIYTSLNNGKLDLAIGAITITDSRLQNYIFSLPYMVSQAQFAVLNKSNYHTLNDVAGKSIGTIEGSDFLDYLDDYAYLNLKIQLYDGPIGLLAALSGGKADVIFLDAGTTDYWLQHSDNMLRALDKPFTIGNGFGIMAMPKNAALIKNINKSLLKIEQDGTYIKLYNIYFTY